MTERQPDYRIVWPQGAVPGSLAIVCDVAQVERLIQLEKAGSPTLYSVRAIVSDHIPLAGDLSDIVTSKPTHRLALNENPLSIYLHHGGDSAVFFDLCGTSDNVLSYVSVEVDADAPLAAFQFGRTAINKLLDTMMRRVWLPLVVSRLELWTQSDKAPLAFQILLPFPAGISIGPLGGIHQYPAFSQLESLAREAISATSPYYRLLCAYRLYDGTAALRRWLRKAADELHVQSSLPKDLKVDHALLQAMGFQPKMLSGVRTVSDLHGKITDLRDQVAHFLLKRDGAQIALHPSDGHSHLTFSMAGAALLHYSYLTFGQLFAFFQEHLQFSLTKGSILPLKEQRERFRIVVRAPPSEAQPVDAPDHLPAGSRPPANGR